MAQCRVRERQLAVVLDPHRAESGGGDVASLVVIRRRELVLTHPSLRHEHCFQLCVQISQPQRAAARRGGRGVGADVELLDTAPEESHGGGLEEAALSALDVEMDDVDDFKSLQHLLHPVDRHLFVLGVARLLPRLSGRLPERPTEPVDGERQDVITWENSF